jgi:hypothetical protein
MKSKICFLNIRDFKDFSEAFCVETNELQEKPSNEAKIFNWKAFNEPTFNEKPRVRFTILR